MGMVVADVDAEPEPIEMTVAGLGELMRRFSDELFEEREVFTWALAGFD